MSHIAKHNYSDSPEFKINIYFNKDKEVVKKKKITSIQCLSLKTECFDAF